MEIGKLKAIFVNGYKKIKQAKIEFSPTEIPSLIIVSGPNGAGKSSFLDAIIEAFKAKIKGLSPINNESDKSHIRLEFENLIIEQIIRSEKTELHISGIDKRPQELLNSFYNVLCFDPYEFSRKTGKQQVDILMNVLGIDPRIIDAKIKSIFDDRTIINRDIGTLKANAQTFEFPDDTPDEETDFDELAKQLKIKEQERDERNEKIKDIEKLDNLIINNQKMIDINNDEIRKLNDENKTLFEVMIQNQTHSTILKNELDSIPVVDTTEIMNKMKNASKININVAKKRDKEILLKSLEKEMKSSQNLTDQILSLQNQKKSKLDSVKMPIDGLSYKDDQILFNDIPFKDELTGIKLKISTAIVLELAKQNDLIFIIIRQGNDLDESNLKMIADMTEQAGGQVLIERIEPSKEGTSIVFHEGEIVN